jgi:RHS repeat-associated protein
MEMEGSFTGSTNKYRYNGKELNDDLGLNLYDYGARFYDPAVGRFMGVDPLADDAPDWSPFRYGFNNPMMYIDPDGMFESRQAARKYRRENDQDIRGAIKKQDDESFAIINRGTRVAYQDIGGDIGVQPVSTITPIDPMSSRIEGERNSWDGGNEHFVHTLRDGSEIDGGPTLIGGTAPVGGSGKISELTKLSRYFGSLSQMSSKGRIIATRVRDAKRLVALYGGKAEDWVKMSSKTYTGKDGFKFATHWYKNVNTGKLVEYKTKIGG